MNAKEHAAVIVNSIKNEMNSPEQIEEMIKDTVVKFVEEMTILINTRQGKHRSPSMNVIVAAAKDQIGKWRATANRVNKELGRSLLNPNGLKEFMLAHVFKSDEKDATPMLASTPDAIKEIERC